MGTRKDSKTPGRYEDRERRRSLVGRRWTDGLRRSVEQDEIVVGPLRILDRQKKVFVHGEEKRLTPKEYELLRLLAANEGKVLSAEELALELWRGKRYQGADDLKQFVYLLRKKIETDPSTPLFIRSIKGFGYVLEQDKNHGAAK